MSEVILQQTKVLQGHDYFLTFLRYFPTIISLSRSAEDEVLKVWQGLGYYSRARNLRSAAKIIVEKHNGLLPNNSKELQLLPGIGPYTAAAIASIAFSEPIAAIDGNVKRVVARVFGLYTDIAKAEFVTYITALLNSNIQNYDPGEFNQAMMELGALICKPKNPSCSTCPLQMNCVAHSLNHQALLPVVTPKAKPTAKFFHYIFIDDGDYTYIKKRTDNGIWHGLYEFPLQEETELNQALQPPENLRTMVLPQPAAMPWDVTEEKHQLTHQTIFAKFWFISGKPTNIVSENKNYLRVAKKELKKFPIHRLMQRYLQQKGVLK